MADNFLERRMEDYLGGKLGKTSCGQKRKSVDVNVHLHGLGIDDLVRSLRTIGVKLSISGVDSSVGTPLAQQCGCTFCPFGLEESVLRMIEIRGRLDVVVLKGEELSPEALSFLHGTVPVVVVGCAAPDWCHCVDGSLSSVALAHIVTALAHVAEPVNVSLR